MGHFPFKHQKNNPYRYESFFESSPSLFPNLKFILAVIIMTIIAACIYVNVARAEIIPPVTLSASWYSIQSLKKEGTYKYSKGVMANGELFTNGFTCANRLFVLGTMLRVTNIKTGKSVIVKTTDRIGKRFATKRIDLSQRAFSRIANCKQGIVLCRVEAIHE